VQRMLWTDMRILLPDIFLEKVDRSTMAHSIEVRVPFIDRSLAQYVLGLPSQYKVRWGKKKRILRSALRGIVPDAVLDAPKTGFGVPYQYWLRRPLLDYMKAVLFDSSIQDKRLFNHKALGLLIHEHSEGKRDWGFFLWKALNLGLWLNIYDVSL
jgi:asparagine synthase (glutamine-hydrolysing)